MANDRWHAGRMMLALARHFDWRQNLMMTEYPIDWGQADLAFISRSRYLTEIEIKVTAADWQADLEKRKFKKPRPHVSRLFYAVPASLIDREPAGLPAGSGLLAVYADAQAGRDFVREVRAARRVRCQPIGQPAIDRLYRNCYYRFWTTEIRRLSNRLALDTARAAAVAS